jgi:hypothetical protein
MNLTYVIYSHTEFLDMLEIASDYASKIKNKVLLINKTDDDISHILSKFDSVIYYDDSLPYTNKVSDAVSKINSKYILFTHEVDIILNVENEIIEKLCDFMEFNNVDRIDLQPNGGNEKGIYYKISEKDPIESWGCYENIHNPEKELESDYHYLGLHTQMGTYVFNVNPSIWKRETYIELFKKFKNRTYRDVEYDDVQEYCSNGGLKVFNLYSNKLLLCGYMNSLPFYKYMHITHYGRLLRFDGSFRTEFEQSYIDVANDYIDIINKYKLSGDKRPFS